MKVAAVKNASKLTVALSVHLVISIIVLDAVLAIADYVYAVRPFNWWMPACSTISFAFFYLLVEKKHAVAIIAASIVCTFVELNLGFIGLEIGQKFIKRHPGLTPPLDALSGLYVYTVTFPIVSGIGLSLWKFAMCSIRTECTAADCGKQ